MDRRKFLKDSALAVIGLSLGIESDASTAGRSSGRIPRSADLLIVGGMVYTGGEEAPFVADVAVSGDRISYVGKHRGDIARKCSAGRVIAADGFVVCPGFIDPHDHVEPALADADSCSNLPYLRMGVTTVIPGQCGGSRFPLAKFFSKLESQGIGTNVASFTGHNTLRTAVMGSVGRHATDEEIEKMKELMRQELDAGSLGLSTGLYYVPGCFSDQMEVVEISKVMAGCGGIYTTHVRNENKENLGVVKSIEEALEIGRKAGVQVNISHIKCLGKSVWHKSDEIISMIEKYQDEGLKVTADQYPYHASGIGMASALTPSWARDGGMEGLRKRFEDPILLGKIKEEILDLIYERGGAETIYISKRAGAYSGMTLADAASKMGVSPADAVVELLKDRSKSPYLNTFVVCDEDLENFMRQPWVMTSTDGGVFGSHPRVAGTYAELIQKYVMEKRVITLDRFIRRSTGQVAETYRLTDRGFIRKGCFADIDIFRPEEVRANATYDNADRLSSGFKYVIVNGKVAVEEDLYTGALAGKVIRRS